MWTCLLVCLPPLEMQGSGGLVVLPDREGSREGGEGGEGRGERRGREGGD